MYLRPSVYPSVRLSVCLFVWLGCCLVMSRLLSPAFSLCTTWPCSHLPWIYYVYFLFFSNYNLTLPLLIILLFILLLLLLLLRFLPIYSLFFLTSTLSSPSSFSSSLFSYLSSSSSPPPLTQLQYRVTCENNLPVYRTSPVPQIRLPNTTDINYFTSLLSYRVLFSFLRVTFALSLFSSLIFFFSLFLSTLLFFFITYW